MREHKLTMRNILHFLLFLMILTGFSPFLQGCSDTSASKNVEPESMSQEQLVTIKKLINDGDFSEAFLQLNHALNLKPNNPAVHINLAWLYLYTENLERAQKEIEFIKKLLPTAVELPHLEGVFNQHKAQNLSQKSNPEQSQQHHRAAILKLRNALTQDPHNHQIHFDLATSLSATGKNEEAVSILDSGFDYIPNEDLETQVNFQIAICSLHAKMELFHDAILDCEQAAAFATTADAKNRINTLVESMKLLNPELTASSPSEQANKDSETN